MLDSTCSKTALTGTVTTSRDELNVYAHEWNELLSSSSADTIFLTWEWISTWLEVVHPEAQLFVVAVRDDDGHLVAVAPFYVSTLRLGGLIEYSCLRIIGDCQCGAEYGGLIVRGGFESEALRCVTEKLLEGRDQWDCIYICNAAGWTGARYSLSVVWKESGFYLHERVREFSCIELPETHEGYLRLLSRNCREQIRRKGRRLEEVSDVELVCCDRQDQLSGYLSNLFRLHRKRWESVGEAGSFARKPAMRRFYEVFAPVALRKGWLRLYALKIDGLVAAVQYGYAYAGAFSQLQEGFDPDTFAGVGNILRNRVIKACIEEQLSEYDFLGGFTDHKRRWGAKARNGYDLFVGRNSFKNRLLFWKNVSPRGRFISHSWPTCY